MQGRVRSMLAIGLLAAFGCQDEAGPVVTPAAAVQLAGSFDAADTGTIQGRVSWQGDLPAIPHFRVHPYLDYANAARLRGEYPNPHQPEIDAETGGVGEVVIFLREVQPSQSKPWSHGSAQVEADAQRLTVVQGKQPARIGFVR